MPEEGSTNIEVRGSAEGVVAGQISGGTFHQYFVSQETNDQIIQRPLIKESPYKGLDKFEPVDKDKFFGRDALIANLTQDLEQNHLVLLLGASGSGKSSVIRAGIIPQFSEKKFTNLTFVPDENPFESLYICLSSKYRQTNAKIAQKIEADTLVQVVETLKQDSPWLIFIDQFEELFTRTSKDKCEKFIDSLVQLIAARNDSLKIILAMRADFYDRFSPYPHLATATERYVRYIADMNQSELKLAIAEPAARNGVVFQQGLIKQIINDFEQQIGCLPLLQYTLNLLWEKHDLTNRNLNAETYDDLQGVTGALQQQADTVYTQLTDAEKAAAKKIFIDLVDVVGNKPVSRRTEQAKFDESEVEKTTLQKFISERLLVAGKQKSTVEVAHEALLTAWPTLQAWIKEAEESLILRKRLEDDAQLWSDLRTTNPQKASEELWSGSKLARFLELREQAAFKNLNQVAIHFINASVEWRDQEKKEKDEQIHKLELALTKSRLQERAMRAQNQLTVQPLDSLVLAIQTVGENLEKFPEQILNSVQTSLYKVMTTVKVPTLFPGHEYFVCSVAFSPNGQIIASGGDDKTVRLWDIKGNPIAEPLREHEDQVYSVAFSPDGQIIASGSADNTVRLWDIKGNSIAEPLCGHEDSIRSVAFSPDGQIIASGSTDNTVRLWDIKGNPIAEPLRGHENGVNSVAFSPDGQIIASGSADNTVRLWDIKGNPIAEPLRGHGNEVISVAFSPDGQIIASGGADNTVRLWDIKGNSMTAPDFSEAQKSASSKDSLFGQIFNNIKTIANEKIGFERSPEPAKYNQKPASKVLRGHESYVTSVAFSPDGQIIASGSFDNTVRLWDIEGNSICEPLRGHGSVVMSVAFSPDGQIIASSSTDNTVRLWDIHENPTGEPLCGHGSFVNSVAFSPDGQIIASGSFDNTVRLWDIKGNPIAEPLRGHENDVNSVAFSPDGQIIASGSVDNTVRLWDIRGNPIAEPLRGHEDEVMSVAFSPDGQIIASGSTDNTVRLWDMHGKPIAEPLFRNENAVISVTFSPDGQIIASGSTDNTVRLWDIKGNPIAEPLRGHGGYVMSVAFSPDGQIIASGSWDNTVRLWDIKGNPIAEPLRGHGGFVISVAFSPDGQMIASGSFDNTIRLWKCRWQEWLQVCCDRLRDHSIFQNPQTVAEKQACETCQKYVWNPTAADEFNRQGVAKRQQKALQAAFDDFSRAILIKPNHTGAYYNRAITRRDLKDYQGAIEDFNYLIRLIPNHASAHEYRGVCYAKLGNRHLAVKNFQKAAELYQQQGQPQKHQKVLDYLQQFQN